VILDTKLRLPLRSRLAATAHDWPTLALAGPDASAARQSELEAAGVQVARVPTGPGGSVDINAALRLLAARGLTRVFSEGGPSVARTLIGEGLADEIVLFTSPKPLARAGVRALDEDSRAAIANPSRYRIIEDAMAGVDRMRIFERAA
jgi:diaminohydroxyphosphoribosylaminopyrimidine deaminase/5-amino-6-(5-phosphoribosylamino)uracil reductase